MLSALIVVKRLVACTCALSLVTGCILNPQGEDPGFEEDSTTVIGGPMPAFPDGVPGPGTTPGPAAETGANAPALLPTEAQADSPGAMGDPAIIGEDPASPGVTPQPAGTTPVLTPGPGPSAPQGAGGMAAGAGGAGPAPEPAAEPGSEYDGGPFNYASPHEDGGMAGGDAGALDAGGPE